MKRRALESFELKKSLYISEEERLIVILVVTSTPEPIGNDFGKHRATKAWDLADWSSVIHHCRFPERNGDWVGWYWCSVVKCTDCFLCFKSSGRRWTDFMGRYIMILKRSIIIWDLESELVETDKGDRERIRDSNNPKALCTSIGYGWCVTFVPSRPSCHASA